MIFLQNTFRLTNLRILQGEYIYSLKNYNCKMEY